MPGLIEWNNKNRDFAKSAVGQELEKNGCVWIMQEAQGGAWKVRIMNTERVDMDDLQNKTRIKLEPANERY
jgi:hypothetical protein